MEDKSRKQFQQKIKISNPAKDANWLSHLFFCWQSRIFLASYRNKISEECMYGVLEDHEASQLGNIFESAWNTEMLLSPNPSLWNIIVKTFTRDFLMYSLIALLLELFIKIIIPILLGYILTTELSYKSIGFYVSATFARALFFHNYTFKMQLLGMKIKTACSSLIYRKALKISKANMTESTAGQVVNLLSYDVNRFELVCMFLPYIVLAPIQFVVTTYLLYVMLGITPLVGTGLLLLIVIVLTFLVIVVVYRRRKLIVLKTDHRVQLINEIIYGIKVIKMYTWEKPFSQLVQVSRKLEMKEMAILSYISSIRITASITINRLVIFSSLILFVMTGNMLTSEYIFTFASFLETLRQGFVVFLSLGGSTLSDIIISVKRIEQFLILEFLKDQCDIKPQENIGKIKMLELENKCGVRIKRLSVKYNVDSKRCILKHINFIINPQEFVVIIGPTGSGKTTLLHTILNEVKIDKGSIEVNGCISYASQDPWIYASSIKQNILFGERMLEDKYKKIISLCGLEMDFSKFPFGDKTLVGEKGAMLSGGQKSRINLARCLYRDADIYILDDPFSALDLKVGKQIFENCILNYLKEKCVILVTNRFEYVKQADRIYFLKHGRNAASGTFEEIIKVDDEFLQLLHTESVEKTCSNKDDNILDICLIDNEEPKQVNEYSTMENISFQIYIKYFRSGKSYLFTFAAILLFLLTQSFASFIDYFLLLWANSHETEEDNNLQIVSIFDVTFSYLEIYTISITIFIIFAFVRAFVFIKFCMRISNNLHKTAFFKVINSPMTFFYNNPSGRILNRFTNDIGAIDEKLPISLLETFQITLQTSSVFILISIVNHWLVIPTITLFIILSLFYKIGLRTTTCIKRIEGKVRSPILSHLNASIRGLLTIRSCKNEAIVKSEFDEYINTHTSISYMLISCETAFGFWLDIFCVLFTFLILIILLSLEDDDKNKGNIGLIVTQLLSLVGQLQYGMKCLKEVESSMTSVERIMEYSKLPIENDEPNNIPHKCWPTQGNIEFKNVIMRYFDSGPIVLNNINLKIGAKEKIGIVGRTGAGKSSLITSLFRLASFEGQIIIDGVDSKEIPLKVLRSKISIIPQEPFLFSETIRKNIDPLDGHADSEIWKAVEEVELKRKISGLALGLQGKISEGGSNFSLGERQLLCLARALLYDNKILILDEATANIDPYTAQMIEQSIRKIFHDYTILIIAHKIDAVLNCDKIVVMDAGEVVEFDKPRVLLQNKNGVFYQLMHQDGSNVAA